MKNIALVSPDRDLVATLQAALAQTPEPVRLLVLRDFPAPDQLSEMLQAENCKAVVLDLSWPERALSLIENLRVCHANLPLVAAHRVNSGELILAAARAGATAYVGPPFAPADLYSALQAAPAADEFAQGSLIAVVPASGGCGASTVAIHLAAAISDLDDRRTLLMDLDLQSSALEFRLQLRPEFTLADALDRAGNLDELWQRLATRWKGGEILPAPAVDRTPPEKWLRLPAVVKSARRAFDVVVADLPPSIGHPHTDVLADADEVLLVSTPEPAALHMARRKAEELRRAGVDQQAVRLVMNRVGGRDAWSRRELAEFVAMPVAWTLSNDYPALRQACLEGALVSRNRALAEEFHSLAHSLIHPEQPQVREEAGWKHWLSLKGIRPRRWARACST